MCGETSSRHLQPEAQSVLCSPSLKTAEKKDYTSLASVGAAHDWIDWLHNQSSSTRQHGLPERKYYYVSEEKQSMRLTS